SNNFMDLIWGKHTLISAGGYTREMALEHAEHRELIVFGCLFLPNVSSTAQSVRDWY
ncbi:hypothetical protein C8R43DRAFT_909406, partial [Mycena crocata]